MTQVILRGMVQSLSELQNVIDMADISAEDLGKKCRKHCSFVDEVVSG